MSQPATTLQAESNLARWQARLAEAERHLRQRQAEAPRLYPTDEARQAAHTAEAAQKVQRMGLFVKQGTQELAQAVQLASQPAPRPVPAQRGLRGLLARLLTR